MKWAETYMEMSPETFIKCLRRQLLMSPPIPYMGGDISYTSPPLFVIAPVTYVSLRAHGICHVRLLFPCMHACIGPCIGMGEPGGACSKQADRGHSRQTCVTAVQR